MKRTFERIFIHTTDSDYNKLKTQFFAVNRWHKDRFGFYFNKEAEESVSPSSMGYFGGYTTLIEQNGVERRFREDWEETMAVRGWNRRSLSVALAGDGDIQLPTEAQANKLKERVNKWCKKYNLPKDKVYFVAPHRAESPNKTCFGSLLRDDYVLRLLDPVKKDSKAQEKKTMTEAQKSVLVDSLRQVMLKLTILLERLRLQFDISTRNK